MTNLNLLEGLSMEFVRKFLKEETGVTAAEYGMILGWLLPLFFLPLQPTGIGLPLGPLVLGALFILTLYRAITSTKVSIPNN
jgi:hypothetical protein